MGHRSKLISVLVGIFPLIISQILFIIVNGLTLDLIARNLSTPEVFYVNREHLLALH
jgi:hypothetical protein